VSLWQKNASLLDMLKNNGRLASHPKPFLDRRKPSTVLASVALTDKFTHLRTLHKNPYFSPNIVK
jgi:hypothetical protein